MQSDSIIIIPTYNEKENIRNIITAIFDLGGSYDILVIDDGSPDGTAAIVKQMQTEQPFESRLHLMERSGKQGLGTAYIAGFKWALQREEYRYIFEMDADFSHSPKDVPRLYAACHDEGYDLAIGSRYVSGVNVVNWPMGRVLMSYYASKYVRLVTGMKMKFTAYKLGFKIKEVSVVFVNRQLGTSKMSGGIFSEAMFGVIRLKWDSLMGKFKKKPTPTPKN